MHESRKSVSSASVIWYTILFRQNRTDRPVAGQLSVSEIGKRAAPPVLVVVSDGYPSDSFEFGLRALMAQPWGKKAVRIAIGIGTDTEYELLQKFIGDSGMKPLQANNPEDLVRYITDNGRRK